MEEEHTDLASYLLFTLSGILMYSVSGVIHLGQNTRACKLDQKVPAEL